MGEFLDIKRPHATAKDNIGGIAATLYLARTDKFTLIAEFVTPVVNPEDAVTIEDDHTFGVSDGFTEMEGDFKKNMWEGEKAGDWGSNNKKWTVKAFFYGTGKEVVAAEAEYNNAEMIILARKLKAGPGADINQFGLKDMPARCVDAKWTSGTPDSGFAGIEFTFESYHPTLAFYEGIITMKP